MNGNTAAVNGQSKVGKDSTKVADSNFEHPYPKLQKTASWLVKNKLSPEFDNPNDETELGKMMGDDGEKLLNLVDDIRKIDTLRNVELKMPEIVVLGDTSAGKSSVLQALTRLPFPVASNVCTRFVTQTTIRRCAPSETPGYTIEVKTKNSDIGQTAPISPRMFNSVEWSEVYQKLKGDIADTFYQMSPENLSPIGDAGRALSTPGNQWARVGSNHPDKLLKHTLVISVRKPDQAHFSIVDIPGLISSTIEYSTSIEAYSGIEGSPSDVSLSEELARCYIQNPEAIILAVTPADNVVANQKGLTLVDNVGALGRTIGVITKCDLIQNRDEGKVFDILRNKVGSEDYLELGWFAVRNRSPEEVVEEESFDDRDRKETEMFAGGKWKKALIMSPNWDAIKPEVLGTPSLKRTLQRHLLTRVKENFPDLKKKMRSLENEYENSIRSMGDPRDKPRDQRVYLSDIQQKYENEVYRSLNGDYRSFNKDDPSRLRHHVNKFNDELVNNMHVRGLKYSWQENEWENDKGILNWIYKTWEDHRGSEPRYDTPISLKKALVKQQTEAWEQLARDHIRKVENAIKKCNDALFDFTCTDEELRQNIREKLEAQQTAAFAAAESEFQKILLDRNYIDSWNPRLTQVTDELQAARMERHERHERQFKNRQEMDKARQVTPDNDVEASREKLLDSKIFYTNNTKVYAVHDWLCAYWYVSFPRFVDNIIIQVVERHLLGSHGPLSLFNRKWIFQLDDEELQDLVGENQKTRDDRNELKQRLQGLKEALKKADTASC